MNESGELEPRTRTSTAQVETLPFRESMVPVPNASMRVLEFVIASLAIVVAILLGFAH